ncbi:MAG: FG-GAP repeat protein [Candidatus Zixiibacteriota bacterium]|nr:MAG: FG-GAP repeat protein [candidate division Zixibacteria bacterium]
MLKSILKPFLGVASILVLILAFADIGSAGGGPPDSTHVKVTRNFGLAVEGGPRCDLDGDGKQDFIVGAPYSDRARGKVYIFSGADGHMFGFVNGEGQGDRFGWSVSCVGDVNNDGRDDLLIGAPFADTDLGNDVGKVYLYSMEQAPTPLDGTNIKVPKKTPIWRWHTIAGPEAGARFGWSVSSAGDLDNDSYCDFLVGAPGHHNGAGLVRAYAGHSNPNLIAIMYFFDHGCGWHAEGDSAGYVVVGDWNFYSLTARPDFVYSSPYRNNKTGAVTLIDSDGDPVGFWGNQLNGSQQGDLFGFSMVGCHLGLVDLIADLVVGSPGKNNYTGSVKAYSGGVMLNPLLFDAVITGDESGARFGYSVAYTPQFCNGFEDDPQITVGSPYAGTFSQGMTHSFYRGDIYWGSCHELGPGANSDHFGWALSEAGGPYLTIEQNRKRAIIGAPGAGSEGEVYVYSATTHLYTLTPDSGYATFSARPIVAQAERANSLTCAAYPNPFNPVTQLRFNLPGAAHVRLEMFDILGRRVSTLVDKFLDAGPQSFTWDAREFASGVYLYRLQAGNEIVKNKVLLLK